MSNVDPYTALAKVVPSCFGTTDCAILLRGLQGSNLKWTQYDTVPIINK